jgi:hypothetical protein
VAIGFLFVFAVIGAVLFLVPGLLMCALSFGISMPVALSRRAGPKMRLFLLAPNALVAPAGMVAVGLGLLCAGAAAFCALMFWIQMSGSPVETHGDDASSEFHAAFGFEPTSDVRDLHAMSYVFFDSGIRHLRFDAARATVDRILALGLAPSSCAGFDQEARRWPHGAPPPAWWAPAGEGDERACYEVSPERSRDWGCRPYLCRAVNGTTVYFVCPETH